MNLIVHRRGRIWVEFEKIHHPFNYTDPVRIILGKREKVRYAQNASTEISIHIL